MISTLVRRVVPKRYRPIGYLEQLVRERTGCQVRQGPFAAMQYGQVAVGSAYLPKLIGIYERELSRCVEAICEQRPARIVDLGAGEGYYAVGFAMRIPSARVIAFEMQPAGRRAVAEMAALNRVADRVDVRGRCEPADLAAALGGEPQPVVVCDVEGYEDQLLDPLAVPALRRATILVELHEHLVPGITKKLRDRFANTHGIDEIWQEPRIRTEFPWRTVGTSLLPSSYLDWAVSEGRIARMSWLWMVPKQS